MTEKEAIERLKLHKEWGMSKDTKIAINTAIAALETVNFLKERGLNISKLKEVDYHKEVIQKINYNAYMELMEEVLIFRGFNELKKPTDKIKRHDFQRRLISIDGICPHCQNGVNSACAYCNTCGQRLDWSD